MTFYCHRATAYAASYRRPATVEASATRAYAHTRIRVAAVPERRCAS
jgi:hypothetical protein